MGAAKTYLLNLGIKGFGEKSVEKVLDYFGIRILEILREERPEEIKDVPGLRKSVKDELFNTLLGEGILSDLNHFLKVTIFRLNGVELYTLITVFSLWLLLKIILILCYV